MKNISGSFAMAKFMTDDVEDYAIAQVKQLCDQSAFEGCKIRLMPDVHPGKVGPIGFTSSLGDMVMPAVVGVDIGCGMTMAKLSKKCKVDFQKLDKVIQVRIPGIPKNNRVLHRFADEYDFDELRCGEHIDVDRAVRSIGTLGGGNHFIELDRDEQGSILCIIHSGSRYLGKAVCDYYMREGHKRIQVAGSDMAYELTWLEGALKEDYLHDMKKTVEFAELNRKAILDEIVKGMKWKIDDTVSCVHNYIDIEAEVPMIRKGAISAQKDETVIIPINMRDGVILGKGLGNEAWNYSAPHGAGRIMNRSQVSEHYTVSQFKKVMKGIYSPSIGKGTLDEAPFAYRGLDDIAGAINETVKITSILKPIYNFKAGGEEN